MKAARWYGVLSISFLLWLMLFPPWVDSAWAEAYSPDSAVLHRLGHHWRFSVPLHWSWSESSRQSIFVSDWGARIDYRLMTYEAVVGLLAIALAFLFIRSLEGPARTSLHSLAILLRRQ